MSSRLLVKVLLHSNTPDFETAAGATFKGIEVARVAWLGAAFHRGG